MEIEAFKAPTLDSHLYMTNSDQQQLIQRKLCIFLNYICKENTDYELDKIPGKIFCAKRIPLISLEDYLQRFMSLSQCSPLCAVTALIYMDRIQRNINFTLLTPATIHRFMIMALILSAKFWDDEIYSNSIFAKIGGITVDELNFLEICFLELINFSFIIEPEEFDKYINLINEVDLSKVKIQNETEDDEIHSHSTLCSQNDLDR